MIACLILIPTCLTKMWVIQETSNVPFHKQSLKQDIATLQKKKAGKEREASKSNVETTSLTNADILPRSGPRIRASFDTSLGDSMLLSSDDKGLEEDGEIIEKKQQSSKVTQAKSKMNGPRRAEREKEAIKGNSSNNRVDSEDAL